MKMLSSLTTTPFGRHTGRAYKLAVLALAMINRSGISLSLVRIDDNPHESRRMSSTKLPEKKHRISREIRDPNINNIESQVHAAGQVRGKQAYLLIASSVAAITVKEHAKQSAREREGERAVVARRN